MLMKYLESGEKILSRELWEGIFKDDTKEFLDYYYNYKTADNQILVLQGEEENFRAMLQRNPYQWNLKGMQEKLDYIIAVATDEKYRHQGYMRKLLEKIFSDSYLEERPFTYLMPAHPDIYRPFQFAYIYDQKVISIKESSFSNRSDSEKKLSIEESLSEENLTIRRFEEGDQETLASFYKEQMVSYGIDYYPEHDKEYFARQWKEQISENGDIFLVQENEILVGYFYYAGEGSWEVREPLFKKDRWKYLLSGLRKCIEENYLDFEGKIYIPDSIFREIGICFPESTIQNQPIIMIRIVNLKKMLSMIFLKQEESLEEFRVTIKVNDPMIKENSGIFDWIISKEKSEISISNEEKYEVEFDMEELTEYLFGYFENGENSKRKNFQELEKKKAIFQKLDYFKNSHITELV